MHMNNTALLLLLLALLFSMSWRTCESAEHVVRAESLNAWKPESDGAMHASLSKFSNQIATCRSSLDAIHCSPSPSSFFLNFCFVNDIYYIYIFG